MIKYIMLKNIELKGFVGCLPEERINKSTILVNLKMKMSLGNLLGEEKDKIENTVDYRKFIEVTQNTLNERHYAIIENLGEQIAQNILRSFEEVSEVEITVSKPKIFENGIIPEVLILRRK